MVFRNIVFYRYPDYVPVSDRMKDLGYELIPEMPKEYHYLGDVPKAILVLIMVALFATSLFGNVKGRVKPYATNMLMRY